MTSFACLFLLTPSVEHLPGEILSCRTPARYGAFGGALAGAVPSPFVIFSNFQPWRKHDRHKNAL
jgi:hypothetical protein